ncbi:hypothetical protein [Rhodopseudomonas parapalustris]
MASSRSTVPDQSLCRGARVRMSARGRERHPRYGTREGVIVGQGSPSSWRVKFDDRKTVQAIHQDYLERVLAPGHRFETADARSSSPADSPSAP